MAQRMRQPALDVVAPAPPTRTRRRRKIVDDAALADAVLAVGFERLTIEAVARHLETAHSAIYHHVRDREALVALAMDHLVQRHVWPAPTPDWRAYLDTSGRAAFDLLDAHPGLSLELTALGETPPALRAHVKGMCAHLESLGFTPDDAYLAVDLVVDLAFDIATRSRFRARTEQRDEVGGDAWYAQKLVVVLEGVRATLAPAALAR